MTTETKQEARRVKNVHPLKASSTHLSAVLWSTFRPRQNQKAVLKTSCFCSTATWTHQLNITLLVPPLSAMWRLVNTLPTQMVQVCETKMWQPDSPPWFASPYTNPWRNVIVSKALGTFPVVTEYSYLWLPPKWFIKLFFYEGTPGSNDLRNSSIAPGWSVHPTKGGNIQPLPNSQDYFSILLNMTNYGK